MLAWVTGASSGIGRATALELADKGHIVLASARRDHALNELAAIDSRIIPLPLDITDFEACKTAIKKAEDKYGPITLAILNAGAYESDPVVKLDRAAFDRNFQVNIFGTVNALYAVLEQMLLRKNGHVVLVGSFVGYRGLPYAFSYGAAKAALIHMAETLKLELQPHKIRVQLVTPGLVKTPMTENSAIKKSRMISANRAAKELVAGLSEDVFEIKISKGFMNLINVMRFLPNWIYFPIAKRATMRD